MKDCLLLQIYLGLAWALGCVVFGGVVVNNSQECKISRLYLCQISMLMCGITVLAFAAVDGFRGYVVFVWCFGVFSGGFMYSLKMYIYEKVRARNFSRAWGFAQFSMALPTLFGVTISGKFGVHQGKIGCILLEFRYLKEYIFLIELTRFQNMSTRSRRVEVDTFLVAYLSLLVVCPCFSSKCTKVT